LTLRWREILWPLLYVLACLWAGLTWLRRAGAIRFKPFRADRPIVVVGNLHSGGSAKTPVLCAIAEKFAPLKPILVSRGYGGELSREGAKVVDAADGPQKYGDEPWMLFKRLGLPVYIGAHRAHSLRYAARENLGRFFLLDDAFQNFSFVHDIDLVTIQTGKAPEESHCIPLGDLREPFSALRHASAVVLIDGPFLSEWKALVSKVAPRLPQFHAELKSARLWNASGSAELPKGAEYGAFCGIAFPSGFQTTLEKQGMRPAFLEAYPDHFVYTALEFQRLSDTARTRGCSALITTEKDWHKVAPFQGFEGAINIYYLRIEYGFSEEFWYFLNSRLRLS
jgi:tetraacyldisaccharide 4'-kinase